MKLQPCNKFTQFILLSVELYALFFISGELIGVEYLYRQTGQSLQSIVLDPETPQEDVGDDTFDDDEGFDETSIDETVGLLVDDFEVQVCIFFYKI